MKATIVVTGRLGPHDVDTSEALAGILERMTADAGTHVLAYRDTTGRLRTATYAPGTVAIIEMASGNRAISVDVDAPELELPPAPHTSAVDRLDDILGDDPLGLRR